MTLRISPLDTFNLVSSPQRVTLIEPESSVISIDFTKPLVPSCLSNWIVSWILVTIPIKVTSLISWAFPILIMFSSYSGMS